MYYWRAGIKHTEEANYSLVYFRTENLNRAVDVIDMFENYGLQTCNCFFHRLNVCEYIANALFLPVATLNNFQNYSRSVLIG